MHETMTAGALAGLGGTVPMTLTMAALRRFPQRDATPIPPKRVAKAVREKLDIEDEMDRSEKKAFTWLMHYGIGAAGGAVYGLLNKEPEKHALIKGIGFGLSVWAGSYLSSLPALGLTRGPTHEPKQHVAAQIVSHIVWGAVLGVMTARLKDLEA